MKNNKSRSPVIDNKKAFYEYYVEESLECGIELRGNEVKSLRDGKASIKESWISIENGKLMLKKMHITAWGTANKFDIDENRERVLLAHKSQIREFDKKSQQQGYTIIPLKLYFKESKAKVLIGLCKGKHNYDKRRVEKEKQVKLDIQRNFKF